MKAQAHDKIEHIVRSSGLWDGEREQTHAFLTSATPFVITPDQRTQIEEGGRAALKVLEGITRILAIAAQPNISRGPAWNLIRKISKLQVPKFFHPLQGAKPEHGNILVKFDLVEDEDGNFKVAEIDATNRRGLGYTSLFDRVRKDLFPDMAHLPSPIEHLSGRVKRLDALRGARAADEMVTLGYVYAHKERWYLPEFLILAGEMERYGIRLLVGSEHELQVQDNKVFIGGVECDSRVLMDIALKMDDHQKAAQLGALFRGGNIRLIVPPRPFLGSKALLALAHNCDDASAGSRDHKVYRLLEHILGSQIDAEDLKRFRGFVPATRFVSKAGPTDQKMAALRKRGVVIKEVVNSGMKGVAFSANPNSDFDDLMRDARKRPYSYILQDEVVTRQREFNLRNGGDPFTEQRRTRLIVYFVGRELVTGVATACREREVHGGKTAAFAPLIIGE